MALMCSSSHNPLTHFTKCAYDRESTRDRLVLKKFATEREGFKSIPHTTHRQIANDLAQFNGAYGLAKASFSATNHLSVEEREPPTLHSSDSQVIAWAAEFNSGGSSNGNARLSANKHYLQPHDYSKFTRPWPHDKLSRQQEALPYSKFPTTSYSRPVYSAVRTAVDPRSALAPEGQLQYSFTDETLEEVDWEAIFHTLDPAMRESDDVESLDLDDPPRHPHPQESFLKPAPEQRSNASPVSLVSNYNFQDENPFTKIPSPFEEGMKIINTDGNLSLAALAFEAACQLNSSHIEAWIMLGTVQSENEREGEAIRALKEALILDSDNLDAMMKLSVSYTNEGYENLAYEGLERWLRIKYPYIAKDNLDTQAPSQSQSFERIKELFLHAAQLSITSDAVDPDVQVGLGVLLFSESNYDMAADCFASAIHSFTPGKTIEGSQLHLLWNRYGACLGNKGQYKEAIEAYEMALAVRPNFVRARTNLGLLHYNKNDPLMGARHTLKAIQEYGVGNSKAEIDMLKIVRVGRSHGRLEEVNYGTEPTSIYTALKKCCYSMCRWDLAGQVGPNMDLRKFERELESP